MSVPEPATVKTPPAALAPPALPTAPTLPCDQSVGRELGATAAVPAVLE